MRSRQRSPEAPDADHCDDPADLTDPHESQPRSGDEPAVSVAEDEEAARAEARAEAARERVMRLRRAVETADAGDDDGADPGAFEQAGAKSFRSRLRLPRRPGPKAVAVGATLVLVCASLGASGYMVWQHRNAMHERQLAQEYAAAARLGITAMMSIDPNHAKEDFQRAIDASTGDLKAQLSVSAPLLAKQAEESKVTSKVTVQAVAVESVTDNSGVVLVAAKSDATGPDNAKRPPALWRLSVNINRDGGQPKMSKVDFLQ